MDIKNAHEFWYESVVFIALKVILVMYVNDVVRGLCK